MNSKLISLLVFYFTVAFLNAQERFEKIYQFHSNVHSKAVIPINGGFILFGQASDTSGLQPRGPHNILLRVNEKGDTIWTKKGNDFSNHYNEMIISDSTIKLIGSNNPILHSLKWTIIISNYNLSGDSLNSFNIYPYDTTLINTSTVAMKGAKLSDGGFVISGYNDSFACCNSKLYVLKIDSLYNIVWHWEKDNGNPLLYPSDIIETSDHFILMTYTENYNGIDSRRSGILKLDGSGNEVWIKEELSEKYPSCIVESITNQYLICGSMEDPLNGPPANYHGFVERLDTSGNVIWLDTSISDYYIALCSTYTDGIAIVGSTLESNHFKLFFKMYDFSGQILFEENFRNDLASYGTCINMTSDSGFIIGGIAKDTSPAFYVYDYYLIKTDRNGRLVSNENINYNKSKIDLFPNPIMDNISIHSALIGKYKVTLYSATGALIYDAYFEGNCLINFNKYTSGIYLINISNMQNKIIYSEKLIKIN